MSAIDTAKSLLNLFVETRLKLEDSINYLNVKESSDEIFEFCEEAFSETPPAGYYQIIGELSKDNESLPIAYAKIHRYCLLYYNLDVHQNVNWEPEDDFKKACRIYHYNKMALRTLPVYADYRTIKREMQLFAAEHCLDDKFSLSDIRFSFEPSNTGRVYNLALSKLHIYFEDQEFNSRYPL